MLCPDEVPYSFLLFCPADHLGAVSPGSSGPAEARAGRGAGEHEAGALRCPHLQPSHRGNIIQLRVQIPSEPGSHSGEGVERGRYQR